MNKKEIIKYAVINSLSTALYIVLISSFLYFAQAIFGQTQSILIPIAMLSLFVFSAALSGALVLGRPILWYLDGKKKEAILLFTYTLASFFVITVVVLFLNLII